MIAPAFCQEMSRYNAWQNKQILSSLQALPDGELTRDHGAFFGSILGTLNHLLWGDALWMSRFDGGPNFGRVIAHSTELTHSVDGWLAERDPLDARITDWANGVTDEDLQGDLTWVSGATGQENTKPKWHCVTHFFNHQTHHRGQVHAMLTASGVKAPVTDLVFMPGG